MLYSELILILVEFVKCFNVKYKLSKILFNNDYFSECMIGDVNMFYTEEDDQHTTELEIMIAGTSHLCWLW